MAQFLADTAGLPENAASAGGRVEQQGEGHVRVAIAAPEAMFTLVDSAGVAQIAGEAEERLLRVADAATGKESV